MRTLKTLALAGFAMIAANAFLGPASASATRLCKTAAGSGTCTSTYAANTKITASSSSSELKTKLGTIACKKSTVGGVTTDTGGGSGTPVHAEIQSLTFSECNLGSTACAVTTVNLSYSVSFAWASSNDGDLIVGTGKGGDPGAHVVCSPFLDCTFTGAGIKLDVLGDTPAQINAINNPLKEEEEGFLCPHSASWTASYTVSAPSPLFLSNS